jgi:hypothetical protein
MPQMKLIMENWNRYITNEQQEEGWVTWRMLSDTIDMIRAEKEGEETAERKKKLLRLGGKSLLKLAASLTGPLGAAVSIGAETIDVIGDMVNVYVQADDSKTNQNPFLDLFNLDDGYEDLIDDRLEDRFVEKIIGDIPDHINQNPDQVIPDFDNVIQSWLPTLDLSGTTDNNVTKARTDGE